MTRLPFITFEGSEGSGKSTQADRLAARLQRCGVPHVLTREPGGTPIGESIRDLLQFAPHNSNMTPETELLLFEASRSQLVREMIKPSLERGMCVIADRFSDSTTVYQGAARKLDRGMIERLNAFAIGDCVPDITFVLDVDAATAQSRMQREPRKADRMEQQPAEFYERVREGYRELADARAKAHRHDRWLGRSSTRSKNRSGKRFVLVFLCWQRHRTLEMAFARTDCTRIFATRP